MNARLGSELYYLIHNIRHIVVRESTHIAIYCCLVSSPLIPIFYFDNSALLSEKALISEGRRIKHKVTEETYGVQPFIV